MVNVQIEIEALVENAERRIKKFANDTNVVIDQVRRIELESNVSDLNLDLTRLRARLAEVKKEGKD